MTVRIIDVETTGIDPATDRVCQIASVDLARIDGTELFGMNHPQKDLVNPGRTIPPQASAIHHIIDEDVAGKNPLEDIISQYEGASCYVAHNAEFDRSFLPSLQEEKWICTLKCALRIWPDQVSHSNQALRYYLGHIEPFNLKREDINAHDALSDVYITAALFTSIIGLEPSFKTLMRWSSEPALYTTINFGKHYGQKYDDVPLDYLEWMVGASDMDEGKRFSAKVAIERRAA